MEGYLSYVSAYDPSLRGRLRGASGEQITKLAELVGRTLPGFYVKYLSYAGRDDGGIDLSIDGTTNIDEIIAYYQEEILPGKAKLPPQCILIGVNAVSIPDVALEHGQQPEPSVVFRRSSSVCWPSGSWMTKARNTPGLSTPPPLKRGRCRQNATFDSGRGRLAREAQPCFTSAKTWTNLARASVACRPQRFANGRVIHQ